MPHLWLMFHCFFLPCLLSCQRSSVIPAHCVFLWEMCSRAQRHVIHTKHIQQFCYQLSDSTAFYFVVKQFTCLPLPISSLLWLSSLPPFPTLWLGHISSTMLHNFTLALLFNGRCHWEAVTSFLLKPAFPHLLSWKLLTRLDEKRASTQERCGTISTQAYSVVSFWFLYLDNLLFSRLQDVTSWLDGLYIGNSFFSPTTVVRVQSQIKV